MGNGNEQRPGRMIKKGTPEYEEIFAELTKKSLSAQDRALEAANELARMLMKPEDNSANGQGPTIKK